MTSPASRAGALAAIGGLSVLAPVMGAGSALLFGAIAILVLAIPSDSRLFEYLATVDDHETGRLRTFAGFLLAVGVLALFGTVDAFGLSAVVFSMTVVLIAFGHAGEIWIRTRFGSPGVEVLAFSVVGALAGFGGYLLLREVPGIVEPAKTPAAALFIATVGALAAALYRVEMTREDPLGVVAVGLLLWYFAALGTDLALGLVALAIMASASLGAAAYLTDTASIAGMLSGTILALLTLILGGPAWFVMLVAFFAIGGIATKYRYEEKAARGVAESEQGARGTSNVMSNGLIPLGIVLGWSTVSTFDLSVPFTDAVFLLAFAGAVATALADTLASELGSLYDDPRLITSLEPVSPGTDGAVTVQGHLAGLAGTVIVASLVGALTDLGGWAAIPVVIGGLVGMTADSLLGATLEDRLFGNDLVNFLATCVGAFVAGAMGMVF